MTGIKSFPVWNLTCLSLRQQLLIRVFMLFPWDLFRSIVRRRCCLSQGMYQLLSFYKSRFSRVVGFLPTGWAFGKSISRPTKRTSGPLTIFGVPYSEHSNYNELRACVGWLKPSQIIPTVDCHTPEKVKVKNL